MQHRALLATAVALLALTTSACHSAPSAPTSSPASSGTTPLASAASTASATSSSATPRPSTSAEPTQTVTGPGYSVAIPASWRNDPDPGHGGATFDMDYTSPSEPQRIFQSMSTAVAAGATVAELKSTYAQMFASSGSDYQDLGGARMGGEDANLVAVTDKNTNRRNVAAYAVHGSKVYIASYSGQPADQAALRALLDASLASWAWQ